MPTFTYNARNAAGRSQKGTQTADSASALAQELRGRGLLVLDVKPAATSKTAGEMLQWLWPSMWLPPRSLDIELSLQQLSVMLRSGLTLLTSLRAVADYATRRSMGRIWKEVSEKIQRGSSFADALAGYRRFPHLVVQLVRVGEQTGTLDVVVTRAAASLERNRLLRTHLFTAMMYPCIVLFAAFGVAGFMIVGVIPKLQVFLKALGKKLPPMTQALLDFSDFVQVYGLWMVGGFLLLICVSIALYLWPPGRLAFDRRILRVPIVGHLLRLSATVGFAHGLSVLLTSGITLVEALRTVEEMSRNRFVRIKVNRARLAVLRGSSLAEPLTGDTFQPMLSRMVAVGESSGNLDGVLTEVASFHEQQLQGAIKRLSVLVEPAIVVIVGGVVGFVYIAFFMALFAAAGGSR
jgi:type II secretory pathway component PulF